MRGRILFPFITLLFLIHTLPAICQGVYSAIPSGKGLFETLEAKRVIQDSGRKKTDIYLSRMEAIKYLQNISQPYLWNNTHDPLRTAIGQLIFEASNPPYDSVKYFLQTFPFDSMVGQRGKFYKWEPVPFSIPDPTAHSVGIEEETDSVSTDSSVVVAMTRDQKVIHGMKDTTIMGTMDTLSSVNESISKNPFRYYAYPYRSDSIKAAVNVLVDFLEARDSSIINISDKSDNKIPVWLNSRSGMMVRYWLKNDLNDSVAVWIGNPERNTIGLYLENGVSFRRPAMQGNVSGAKVNVNEPDKSRLLGINKIITKTQYWKYRAESSFALNQGMLTNWVKGGESSISTALDVTAYLDYSNKPMLLSSNNFARLKYGLIASGEKGIMKNLDLLETNSKLNHKAFGKFDFSAVLLFKTQIDRGKSYTKVKVNGIERDTAFLVSKFFNPATLTIGLGLDYKPNKLTSINFSPLSYKATFVPDTVLIDQTKYGVPKDKRSKHEPGASFMISSQFSPVKSIVVTNRLQLFTNYINNPLNIDVDWEMILVANLNWFTDVRLNTHLIFDDDTKTPLYDKDHKPVPGTDGLQKKTARIQFKEMIGLSFVFRF